MNVHGDAAMKTDESEALAALRRFARPRAPAERCELCGAVLAPDHQHLLHRESRQVACGCDACAVLFSGQEGSKYLRIPRRVRRLTDFGFSDLEWEAMMLPIHLAFFLRDAEGSIVAMYPSPAGAVQSELGMQLLEQKFAGQAELRRMEAEVETLLVNRAGEADYFIAPIDECYRLVGLIRMKWRGLSGGAEVEAAIESFFRDLRQRAEGMACPS
jgi:hypothetical protein